MKESTRILLEVINSITNVPECISASYLGGDIPEDFMPDEEDGILQHPLCIKWKIFDGDYNIGLTVSNAISNILMKYIDQDNGKYYDIGFINDVYKYPWFTSIQTVSFYRTDNKDNKSEEHGLELIVTLQINWSGFVLNKNKEV